MPWMVPGRNRVALGRTSELEGRRERPSELDPDLRRVEGRSPAGGRHTAPDLLHSGMDDVTTARRAEAAGSDDVIGSE
jgi:hypothetical protein